MEMGTTIIILVLIGIASYLAVRFHDADKKVETAVRISDFLAPITIDNASAMLEERGCTLEAVDEEIKCIFFSMNGTRFTLDIERHPLTFLYLRYEMGEETDREALERAAEKVSEDIVMVKVSVSDNEYTYLIASCESCIGNLKESFDKYLEILDDAQRRMAEAYHEFLDEKDVQDQEQVCVDPAPDGIEGRDRKLPS